MSSAVIPANVVVTGPVGSGKSYWAQSWCRRWARRGGLVIIDRSDQHAGLVSTRLVLSRETVTRAWRWDRLLVDHPRLLVQVTADPASAWPALTGLADALYRVGQRRLLIEEAQRWTPGNAAGARALALLATDARRRAVDWCVVAPEVIARLGGVAQEWQRESRLRVAFAVSDPLQVGHLGDWTPAWRPHLASLRPLRQVEGGRIIAGEYLVWDARVGRGARVDAASGRVVDLGL